jgi:hypothetical protein
MGMHTGLGLWRARYLWQCLRKEGPQYGYLRTSGKVLGQLSMEHAAPKLSPAPVISSGPVHEFHLLTGKQHYKMSIFVLYSLIHTARANIRPIIHDDGSIDQQVVDDISRVIPNAVFVLSEEIQDCLASFLPESRFPVLRKQRLHFKLMRKLTDVHAWKPGWNVFLDSDMLFFRRPDWLLDWQVRPTMPICMEDCMNSYGYSPETLSNVLSAPMPNHVNTGICGLNGTDMDWDRIEYWCKALLEKEGLNHFLEQALTAMWLSGRPYSVAPSADYIVYPKGVEARHPTAVMLHYVDTSREEYYRWGWRSVKKGAARMRAAAAV